MVAVLSGADACVRLLLEQRDGIANLQNTLGVTSLMLSCSAGRAVCCELLLKHGAKCGERCGIRTRSLSI